MKKIYTDKGYQVVGYDEKWNILDDYNEIGCIFSAEKEAKKFLESGDFAHVVIRETNYYEVEL